MSEVNRFDERAVNSLLPYSKLPTTTQDALRVMGTPCPQKIMIHKSAGLLVATVLSTVPYAKRRDIREGITRAVWSMVEAAEMPEHEDGTPRMVYAARCAARLLWFFEDNDKESGTPHGDRPRAKRHLRDAKGSSI